MSSKDYEERFTDLRGGYRRIKPVCLGTKEILLRNNIEIPLIEKCKRPKSI